ncbi:5986_t:CDS:1, partial [Ambispora leptoticha]
AYEHGGVVQIISKSFGNELFHKKNYPNVGKLTREEKSFVKKVFDYFYQYTNQELWDFSHDDPS